MAMTGNAIRKTCNRLCPEEGLLGMGCRLFSWIFSSVVKVY